MIMQFLSFSLSLSLCACVCAPLTCLHLTLLQDDKNYPAISSQTRQTAFQQANAAMKSLIIEGPNERKTSSDGLDA
jgi:hypothetical protein